MNTESVEIWHGIVTADEGLYDGFWIVLDEEERRQAKRFSNTLLHNRYVEVHGRLRYLLADKVNQAPDKITINKTKQGKPYLADYPELAFNLSHSAEQMLVAFAWNCRVGIDVEQCKSRANLNGLVNKCFAEPEKSYWNQLPDNEKHQAFYRFWTRKEAFVKATGHGIVLGLDQCVVNTANPVEFTSVPVQCGKASIWSIQDLELGEGLCGAIVADKKLNDIVLMHL
jgi:4'-phosphopantetheinyl transferase